MAEAQTQTTDVIAKEITLKAMEKIPFPQSGNPENYAESVGIFYKNIYVEIKAAR